MTDVDRLVALGVRLRNKATQLREGANTLDRYSCAVDVIATAADEERAKEALTYLAQKIPAWFDN